MENDAGRMTLDRRSLLKIGGLTAATAGVLAMGGAVAEAATSETWDKTFPKSDKVDHRKVTLQ